MNKKILSIDDEPEILQCFQSALQYRGYTIDVTTNPDEGIEILRSQDSYDLLVLDVRMPGKNGFDVFREVRAFRPELRVLFVTAYPKSFNTESDAVMEMWRTQFADGTTDIIYKPFRMETFYDKVEGLIGVANEREE